MWNPDPSQVVCVMLLATAMPVPPSTSPAGKVGEYRYHWIKFINYHDLLDHLSIALAILDNILILGRMHV